MTTADPRGTLDALVTEHGESYAALSRMLGRNAAYLQQFVRRGTPRLLPERDRALLADYFRIDEALLGRPGSLSPPQTVAIRRLRVAASAGPGALPDDMEMASATHLDRRLLGVRSTRLAMITVEGDSMEPLLAHGDSIVVDESDRALSQQRGVHVIRLDQTLMVKHVAIESGDIRVSSANAAYPPMALRSPDDVDVIGRVVWLGRVL